MSQGYTLTKRHTTAFSPAQREQVGDENDTPDNPEYSHLDVVLTEGATATFNNTFFSASTLDTDLFDDEALAADEALWDKQFAESQEFLDRMADEIEAEYLAGLTEEFDPDTDPDLQ